MLYAVVGGRFMRRLGYELVACPPDDGWSTRFISSVPDSDQRSTVTKKNAISISLLGFVGWINWERDTVSEGG
jgi:hypothetical protein